MIYVITTFCFPTWKLFHNFVPRKHTFKYITNVFRWALGINIYFFSTIRTATNKVRLFRKPWAILWILQPKLRELCFSFWHSFFCYFFFTNLLDKTKEITEVYMHLYIFFFTNLLGKINKDCLQTFTVLYRKMMQHFQGVFMSC